MGLSQADIDALLSGDDAAGESSTAVEAPEKRTPAPAPSPAPAAPVEPGRPRALPPQSEIERIKKLSVPVVVKLAEREMTISSILVITVGSIVEFEVPADSDLDLIVGTESIGAGQAVKVGENFGLRITRMGSLRERVEAMGGQ